MKRGEHGVKASLRMPDGELVSVGGSLTRSGDLTETEVESSHVTTLLSKSKILLIKYELIVI